MNTRLAQSGQIFPKIRCTSTYYVTLVYDDYIDTFNHVYVTEAVVVNPLMLQIDTTIGAASCCLWLVVRLERLHDLAVFAQLLVHGL